MGVPSEEKRYSKGEAPGRDIAARTFLDSESPVSASAMGTCDCGDKCELISTQCAILHLVPFAAQLGHGHGGGFRLDPDEVSREGLLL